MAKNLRVDLGGLCVCYERVASRSWIWSSLRIALESFAVSTTDALWNEVFEQ